MTHDLDMFTQGFIEAAFFTDTGYPENDDLESADPSEISPESLAAIKDDCEAWQEENSGLLEQAYARGYEPEQAGRDYWFTRNGHGVGFWDRGVLQAEGLGEALSKACRYQEVYIYRGDDGLIYFGGL